MGKPFYQYNPRLLPLARKLRNQSTLSEILLWKELRNKQMLGYDFHRQKPIDEYIVDFCCPTLNLIIEIDGSSHDDSKALRKDSIRQKRLEDLGLKVLRFHDRDVKRNMTHVLRSIEVTISEILDI